MEYSRDFAGRGRSNPKTTLTHAVALDSKENEVWVLCPRVELDDD